MGFCSSMEIICQDYDMLSSFNQPNDEQLHFDDGYDSHYQTQTEIKGHHEVHGVFRTFYEAMAWLKE
jgi:hypothetical protein